MVDVAVLIYEAELRRTLYISQIYIYLSVVLLSSSHFRVPFN